MYTTAVSNHHVYKIIYEENLAFTAIYEKDHKKDYVTMTQEINSTAEEKPSTRRTLEYWSG